MKFSVTVRKLIQKKKKHNRSFKQCCYKLKKKKFPATRRPLSSAQISTKNTIKLKWQLSQECCRK